MVRLLFTLCVSFLAGVALAQDGAGIAATGAGSFAGGAGLAPEADADAIAALEQQAFRELRWDVVAATRVTLAFDAAATQQPGGATAPGVLAEARLMISDDGETFAPLDPATAVDAGQVLALLISQISADVDGATAFYASDWTYELRVAPLVASEDVTLGPVLLPIDIGRALGCEDTGCGELPEASKALSVGGAPDSSAGSNAGSGGVNRDADQELARELQAELARVGCYSIAVDGLWGPGSRRAMAAYNAAKGTELPAEVPTAGTLVAVARETGIVCAP